MTPRRSTDVPVPENNHPLVLPTQTRPVSALLIRTPTVSVPVPHTGDLLKNHPFVPHPTSLQARLPTHPGPVSPLASSEIHSVCPRSLLRALARSPSGRPLPPPSLPPSPPQPINTRSYADFSFHSHRRPFSFHRAFSSCAWAAHLHSWPPSPACSPATPVLHLRKAVSRLRLQLSERERVCVCVCSSRYYAVYSFIMIIFCLVFCLSLPSPCDVVVPASALSTPAHNPKPPISGSQFPYPNRMT